MQRKYLLVAVLPILQACSGDNFNGLLEPQELAFDTVLLDIVDPNNKSVEPVSVNNKRFIFPDDTAAFAGLFP